MEELRRLADQGDAQAQFELGFRHAHGYGVSRDDQEAAKWYRQAADQGDGDAQHALGSCTMRAKACRKITFWPICG
ncbi:MAG: sel1 repeat family protein [Nitrospinae bacterium]|nr:sel1 repeat family protein [Nitrospinota bacterium]